MAGNQIDETPEARSQAEARARAIREIAGEPDDLAAKREEKAAEEAERPKPKPQPAPILQVNHDRIAFRLGEFSFHHIELAKLAKASDTHGLLLYATVMLLKDLGTVSTATAQNTAAIAQMTQTMLKIQAESIARASQVDAVGEAAKLMSALEKRLGLKLPRG